MTTFDVYTDGSCNNKCQYKIGGWAYVVLDPEEPENIMFESSGTLEQSTSNRAELTAVSETIKMFLKTFLQGGGKGITINVISDSAYVVNCFIDRWYERWQEFNYIGISNADLWKDLLENIEHLSEYCGVKVKFTKVKGHAGVVYNERVDKLAGDERKNKIKELQAQPAQFSSD